MNDLNHAEERALAAMRPVFEAHDRVTDALEEMHGAFQKALATIAALATPTTPEETPTEETRLAGRLVMVRHSETCQMWTAGGRECVCAISEETQPVGGSGYCPDACTWPHDHRFERDGVPWPKHNGTQP